MIVGLIVWSPLRHKRRWLIGAAAVAAVVVVAGYQVKASAVRQPTPYVAGLGDELRLLAYDVSATTVQPGDDLALHLYWLVQKTPTVDYKLFAHLIKPDDSGRVAQIDEGPAISYNPTSWWEPGEVIDDEYHLPIDPNTPPGAYLLAVGMYHPETVQNLPVVDGPNTLPGDRMVLTQIEVGDGPVRARPGELACGLSCWSSWQSSRRH